MGNTISMLHWEQTCYLLCSFAWLRNKRISRQVCGREWRNGIREWNALNRFHHPHSSLRMAMILRKIRSLHNLCENRPILSICPIEKMGSFLQSLTLNTLMDHLSPMRGEIRKRIKWNQPSQDPV